MTVFELSYLIHVYLAGGDETPAPTQEYQTDIAQALFNAGHLSRRVRTPVDRRKKATATAYKISDKGRAYVEAAATLPEPVCTWHVPWPAPGGDE